METGQWIPTAIVVVMVSSVFKCEEQTDFNITRSLDIFPNLGLLATAMRVIDQPEEPPWILREPTNYVLQSPIPARGQDPVVKSDFRLEFCDDTEQLLQSYFHGLSIEGIQRPSSAFISNWHKTHCSSYLGLEQSFFDDEYSYILVQISRFWMTARMTPSEIQQIRLKDQYEAEVIPGNVSTVQSFFIHKGTHYISSYSTGNALYQVLVYSKPIYQHIKGRFEAAGVASVTSTELMTYMSPWYAVYSGEILSTSGNLTVEEWAAKHLTFRFYSFSFQSLVQILIKPLLLRALDGILGNEAMLQLELRSLGQAFADEKRRKWFAEFLDNQLKLWEINQGKECLTPRQRWPWSLIIS